MKWGQAGFQQVFPFVLLPSVSLVQRRSSLNTDFFCPAILLSGFEIPKFLSDLTNGTPIATSLQLGTKDKGLPVVEIT